MKTDITKCEKAKNISILDTMKKLGYFPKKENEKEAWFPSPFRTETNPSFKVSLSKNRWFDHGEGLGGNVIDLLVKLNKWSVSEALNFLNENKNSFSFHKPSWAVSKEEKNYTIKKVKNLKNSYLVEYLKLRSIDTKIAREYCKELYYEMNEKSFYSISFGNDSNGYEIRNKYFKGCLGKKDITFLTEARHTIAVFEGFFDFLSFLTYHISYELKLDFLILNSLSMVDKILDDIKDYGVIKLYLDNDEAGDKATKKIIGNIPWAEDQRELYGNFKDLNEALMRNAQVF